jgi:hypothetical protein
MWTVGALSQAKEELADAPVPGQVGNPGVVQAKQVLQLKESSMVSLSWVMLVATVLSYSIAKWWL